MLSMTSPQVGLYNLLPRIDASKAWKIQAQQTKEESLKESQERVPKRKHAYVRMDHQTHPCISQIIEDFDEETEHLRPFIMARLGHKLKWECTLIDTWVEIKSLSYETWEKLSKPAFKLSTLKISTFAGDT